MFATKSAKIVNNDVVEVAAEERNDTDLVPLTVDQLGLIGGGEASVVTH